MSCLEHLLSSDQQWLVLVAGTGYVPMSQIARLASDEDTADEVPREFVPQNFRVLYGVLIAMGVAMWGRSRVLMW